MTQKRSLDSVRFDKHPSLGKSTTMESAPTSTGSVPSGLSSQNLLLDSDIRDWVVIPLLVIMICAGLLRHYVGIWMRGKPKPIHKVEQRAKNVLATATRLRMANCNYLSTGKIEARRRFYGQREDGYLRKEAEWSVAEKEKMEAEGANSNGSDTDAMNPMAMMDGMKGNMVFMVQNMVMMQGISHFFKGFILLKVPFALTRGFKMMFQRDLGLSNLDTSYVSSVSWYFLVMFGLRGFFRLMIGDPTQEVHEDNIKHSKFGLHMQVGPNQFDETKALNQEADNLELLPKHKSDLDDVEKRLLGKKYPRKKIQAKDDLYGYGTVSKSKKRV